MQFFHSPTLAAVLISLTAENYIDEGKGKEIELTRTLLRRRQIKESDRYEALYESLRCVVTPDGEPARYAFEVNAAEANIVA